MINLNQPYSPELFQEILTSLFGDAIKIFDHSRDINPKRYWKYITRMDRIGECSDLEVHFYIVEQSSLSDPRVSVTKEIFQTLADAGHRRAIVAIHNTESDIWRLSLVTMTLDVDEKDRIVRHYTDARRFSFLLGNGEKTRTPEQQLTKRVESFEELFAVFDVEVVRKEFFDNYLELYLRLYQEVAWDESFTQNLKNQKIDLVTFTKTLLGKIVFLYFIQKKWWLGVQKDGIYWRDGNKDFMRWLWDDFVKNDGKTVWEKTGFFYNDYLEHLFYEWLNKDNRDNDDLNEYFNFKVPYLNGWLFKRDYENWNTNQSYISNDIFSNTDKSGILDIFDMYNFTIDEDDLYDKEVAVDPEMLGKIFEKMISISSDNIDEILSEYNKNTDSKRKKKVVVDNVLNKKLGAFYTPREIVHYMTKESLIAYLLNNLKWKREENEEKIWKLFEFKERFLQWDQITHGEYKEEFESVYDIICAVDTLLSKVKILDPAIGSGAFPMGLLHEISTLRYYIYEIFYKYLDVSLRSAKNTIWREDIQIQGFPIDFWEAIDEYSDESGNISMYKIKREVIQNNIYGVDISAGAIEIARLRFWLSLVVDEEIPEPLPNFEFKFVCANTLIPLEESHQQSIEKEINLDTLKNYMSKFYNAQTNKDKDEWKKRIEKFLWIEKRREMSLEIVDLKSNRTKQLETYEPFNPNHSAEFFDPSLMMGNGKFDIVIGNPPYWWSLSKKDSDFFSNNYEISEYKIDTYSLFIEKWINYYSINEL